MNILDIFMQLIQLSTKLMEQSWVAANISQVTKLSQCLLLGDKTC